MAAYTGYGSVFFSTLWPHSLNAALQLAAKNFSTSGTSAACATDDTRKTRPRAASDASSINRARRLMWALPPSRRNQLRLCTHQDATDTPKLRASTDVLDGCGQSPPAA